VIAKLIQRVHFLKIKNLRRRNMFGVEGWEPMRLMGLSRGFDFGSTKEAKSW
jgi:hypothetical protein